MLALVGVQISQTSKLSSKGVEARDDLETLHAMAVSTLQDQVNCTATKNHCHESGKGICLAGPGGTGGETVIAPGGRYMSDSITVDHINFSVPATGTTGVVNIGYRKIHADKKASGYSAEKVTKNIPLKIIRDDDDNFARCYVDQENITEEMTSEFCQSLGTFMTWDATTKKCSLNQKTCWDQPNTMFMGISSTGQPICRNLSNIVNPNEYFSTNAIPNCPNRESIQLTLDGEGKIAIQCNSPACTPTNGTWTYGTWTACDPATLKRSRTASCNAICGGSCGIQQPIEESCSLCVTKTRCATWEKRYFQDYCGRKWTSRVTTAQAPDYHPQVWLNAPDGYFDSAYNCTSQVTECVDPANSWGIWSVMSNGWPIQSRCVQNGNCPGMCSCPATGCPTSQVSGW